MLPLIPIFVVGGVVALALLWPFAASASESSDTNGGTREANGNDTPDRLTIGGDELSLAPKTVVVTGGQYRQIVSGDTGSDLCLEIYAAPKPYPIWLKVKVRPENVSRLGANDGNWFLPRWSVDGESYIGAYTGYYAKVWFPAKEVVGL